MSAIADEKKLRRQQVQSTLSQLTPAQARASDLALFDRLLALPQVEQAKTIFAFWGVAGREPETELLIRALLKRGKRVGLPRTLPNRGMEVHLYDPEIPLVRAGFGLLEPDPACPVLEKHEIDLTLVPSVCYDRQGYRLGFGGGYYDRWLADYTGFRVGLCRRCVLQSQVPLEPHDSRVHLLLTEDDSLSLG